MCSLGVHGGMTMEKWNYQHLGDIADDSRERRHITILGS